jgi:glycerol-3-phosphate dehydrogenase
MIKTDVVIIGAGAVGCAIAHHLSKHMIDVIVVDKNPDVGGDASKSNSAIIHTGFDAKPNTLESMLVVNANPMYDQLVADLDIPFQRVGAIVSATTEEEAELLPKIEAISHQNGVFDVEILTADQVKERVPQITDQIKGGVWVPRESIIDPFIMVVALAENAVANGVRFLLGSKVVDIIVNNGTVNRVITESEDIQTRYVINAAGMYSDDIASMIGPIDFTVHPRRGQFFILDRSSNLQTPHIILPVPTKKTKGKLVSPTTHGNLLIGPTAEDIQDKQDRSVTKEGLDEVLQGVKKLMPSIDAKYAITEYAGLRPTKTPEGYEIYCSEKVMGFVNVLGIRSTGLTSSIAIGSYVVQLLKQNGLELVKNPNYIATRKGIQKFSSANMETRKQLIEQDPRYGNIICRCETISEAEIVQAIHSLVPATSLDGIKRRLRPQMGRCQGSFCTPRLIQILSRELNVSCDRIRKNDEGSELLFQREDKP